MFKDWILTCQSEDPHEATEFIIQYRNSDIVGFVGSLLEILDDNDSYIGSINLCLVLVYQTLSEYPTTDLPDELLNKIYLRCFTLFIHENVSIRNSAVHAFGMVSSVLIRRNNNQEILYNIIDQMDRSQNVEMMKMILLSVNVIFKIVSLEPNQVEFVFSKLLSLLATDELINESLSAISALADNLETPNEEFLLALINATKFQEYKCQSYKCWQTLFSVSPSLIKPVFNELLDLISAELSSQEDENIVFQVLQLIISISSYQISNETYLIGAKFFDSVFLSLVNIMSSCIVDDIPDEFEDFNIRIFAFDSMKSLSRAVPSHSSKVCYNFFQEHYQDPSPIIREVSMRLLLVIYKSRCDVLPDQNDIIPVISQTLNGSNYRVQNVGIRIVPHVAKSIGESIFVPELIEICKESYPFNSVLSIVNLGELSKYKGFDYFNVLDLLYQVVQSSDVFPVLICTFHSIYKIMKRRTDISEHMPLLEPTIAWFDLHHLNNFREDILSIINMILKNVTIGALDYLDLIFNIYIQQTDSLVFICIANLCDYFGENFLPYLPRTVELLINSLHQDIDENSFYFICTAFTVLSTSIYFEPYVPSTVLAILTIIDQKSTEYLRYALVLFASFEEQFHMQMDQFNEQIIFILNHSIGILRTNIRNKILGGCLELLYQFLNFHRDQADLFVDACYDLISMIPIKNEMNQLLLESIINLFWIMFELDQNRMLQFQNDTQLVFTLAIKAINCSDIAFEAIELMKIMSLPLPDDISFDDSENEFDDE